MCKLELIINKNKVVWLGLKLSFELKLMMKMSVMNDNLAGKLEGLSEIKNRFGLGLSLAKNSNGMFFGLFVGFEMITEESLQIVLC